MIVGRAQLFNNKGNIGYFDYAAVVYPLGIDESQEFAFFNMDQIKDIIFLGYESEEEKSLKTELENQRDKIQYPHFEN